MPLARATETPTVTALSSFGLSFLFFMAGYEIEFAQIRGRPLKLAGIGWLVSLAIAILIAGGLVLTLRGQVADQPRLQILQNVGLPAIDEGVIADESHRPNSPVRM